MNLTEQKRLRNEVKNICGEWWTDLSIEKIDIYENIINETTKIKCELNFTHRVKNVIKIEGEGRGVIDALYNSIVESLSDKYLSLKEIKFKEFFIRVENNGDVVPGTNLDVNATLKILNSRGQEFEFSQTATSTNAAAIKTVLMAVTFFINSHVAVSKTIISLKDAKNRRREDLVSKHTSQMTELVKITCYEKFIKDMKGTD